MSGKILAFGASGKFAGVVVPAQTERGAAVLPNHKGQFTMTDLFSPWTSRA